ncbi:MAG: DNA polymerase III subunit delta [Candidatus Pacebacteria bacterium]|nr:DNA polymerase III subunit delta [Candidatus Paceibacterota bacterium]
MPTIPKIKNISLFFGEDDFTIAEEIKKAKKDFAGKFGEINISEIDWENQNLSEKEKLSELQNELMANSLFSSDKLLVVRNALFSKNSDDAPHPNPLPRGEGATHSVINKLAGNKQDEIILKYLENPEEKTRIFFVENSLDKRKRIYKELNKLEKTGLVEIKEFMTPANFNFDLWIKNRVAKLGGKIENKAINILAISLGKGMAQKDRSKNLKQSYNLWEADNEISKLVSYCDDQEITEKNVRLLVQSKVDLNIFNLIDSISSKNRNKSALLLNQQIEKGLNEIYILTMFVYQFRNLLKIKSLLEQNLSNQEIAIKAKMHPFVIQKSIEQCRRFEMQDLKKIYQKLFDADLAIKTGKINPRLALDLLVVSV